MDEVFPGRRAELDYVVYAARIERKSIALFERQSRADVGPQQQFIRIQRIFQLEFEKRMR